MSAFSAIFAAFALASAAHAAPPSQYSWTFPGSGNQVIVDFRESGPSAISVKAAGSETTEAVHEGDVKALPHDVNNAEQVALIRALSEARGTVFRIGFALGSDEVVIVTADQILRISQDLRITYLRGDFSNYRGYWTRTITDDGVGYTLFGVIQANAAVARPEIVAPASAAAVSPAVSPAPQAREREEEIPFGGSSRVPRTMEGLQASMAATLAKAGRMIGGDGASSHQVAPEPIQATPQALAPAAPAGAAATDKNITSYAGMLFMWRQSDGLAVTVSAMKCPNPLPEAAKGQQTAINDGILTIADIPRRIDLRNYDLEPVFTAKPFVNIRNPEGGDALMSPAQYVRDTFTPYVASELTKAAVLEKEERAVVTDLVTTMAMRIADRSILVQNGSINTRAAIIHNVMKHFPRTWEVFSVDGDTLEAGGGTVGVIPARINAMINASRETPIAYVLNPVHSLSGMGSHGGNTNDKISTFIKGMRNGDLVFLGMDNQRFEDLFAANQDFLDRWNRRNTPIITNLDDIYVRYVSFARSFNRAVMPKDVFRRAQHFLSIIDPITPEPDRFNNFADRLAALMAHPDRGRKGMVPTHADVDFALERALGVDPALLDIGIMGERVRRLEKELPERIIGQTDSLRGIIQGLRNSFSGVNDPTKPRFMGVMGGPAGTGKTETVIQVADILGLRMEHINMAMFQHPSDAQALLNQVAAFLRQHPFGILFFDEIEKAHPQVQNALLVMLNNGIFKVEENIDATGQKKRIVDVSARNALIFMATNAASDLVSAWQTAENYNRQELKRTLTEEGITVPLVSRIPIILAFYKPSKEEFVQILKLYLRKGLKNPQTQYGHMGVNFAFEDLDAMAEALGESYSPEMDNREALHLIQDLVNSALSNTILGKDFGRDMDVTLYVESGTGADTNVRARLCARALTPGADVPAVAPDAGPAASGPAPASDETPPST